VGGKGAIPQKGQKLPLVLLNCMARSNITLRMATKNAPKYAIIDQKLQKIYCLLPDPSQWVVSVVSFQLDASVFSWLSPIPTSIVAHLRRSTCSPNPGSASGLIHGSRCHISPINSQYKQRREITSLADVQQLRHKKHNKCPI